MLKYLRHPGISAATLLLCAPLYFSFQLKAPPDYLRGYAFVLLWSWGVLGAVLTPIGLLLECLALGSFALGRPAGRRSAILGHAFAAAVAIGGLLVLLAARRVG